MSKRVLWALAAVGVIATLPLVASSCKKDDPEPNSANNFQGQQGTYGQPGYGQQPGYGTTQPGYGTTQPGYGTTQPGYTQPTGTTQPGQPQPTGTAPAPGTAQPAATNDPFSTLTGMVGGVLGSLGGAAAGGTTGGAGSTDPISLGIQHNASQNAPGMKPDGSMVKLTLQQGQMSEGQFNLAPGKCYTLVGASMPGVFEVAIKVTMPAPLTTQVLGQNPAGANPMPVVWGGGNCYRSPSPLAMPVRLEVKMVRGAGTIGIQPYSK